MTARELRVLVVDDEKGVRDMLAWNLHGDGVAVDAAEDGDDAERMLERETYDLVLTDVTMPHVGGLNLLRFVRRKFPDVPVILMTGFGTVEMAVQAMKDGAVDFVLKPFDVEGMARRVRGLLGLAPGVEGPAEVREV